MTVRWPAASRLPAMKFSTSNASLVTDWSFSSPETRPRQKSLEITSKREKCGAANDDFPDPEAPTRATRHSSGIARLTASAPSDPLLVKRFPSSLSSPVRPGG